MTRAVCSSAIGFKSGATMRVAVPMKMQTQSVYTLSTASGSTTSTMESFSCLSTSSVRIEPIQNNLARDQSRLGSLFQSDEGILEVMMEPDYPWDAMHHHSLFPPKHKFSLDKTEEQEIYVIKSKYFIPSGKFDWFKNPILALDAFEEGNISNISPTIKVNISQNLAKLEEISLGVALSLEEIASYTQFLQEYRDILTLGLTYLQCTRNNINHTHKRKKQ